jgi:PIN domain nuclease of toxin-antitoxin system
VILLDTHALVWWVSDPAQLSVRARRAVAAAERKRELTASAISVLEIATAVRRQRLVLATPLPMWLADVQVLVRIEPVTARIAGMAGTFGDELHGDPADRLIAATAIDLGARLVTADRLLKKQRLVDVIW